MRTRILLIILLVASLGVNAGLLINYYRAPRAAAVPAAGWNCPMMQDRFKLTPAQADDLEKMRLAMVAKTAEIKEALRVKREALLEIYGRPRFNEAKADSLLMTIALQQYTIEKAVFKHLQEVKNKMTPDQQKMLCGLLADELCPGMMQNCQMNCTDK
jgi:Spy/CpxP family protein refolding chaperone